MTLQVLYEDNHLLIVCKPSGMLTEPSGTQQENLEDLCKAWIKETYKKPGNVFLGTVHRLDKPVSGIVIFAKTSKALSRLNASMRNHEFHKIYYAVVEGVPKDSQGVLEHYLFHDDYRSMIVEKGTPQAKFCRLHYRVVQNNQKFALLEIVLETGRYHQIRAQLSAMGHSIIGDAKYQSRETYYPHAIALHHSELKFPHPVLHTEMTIQAPVPEVMLKLIKD